MAISTRLPKAGARILVCVILLLGIFSPFTQAATAAARPAVTFTIDTSTDAHDSNLGDGICSNGVDGCSMRAAIEQAFTLSSVSTPVTILFGSSWAGSTFNLDGTLGTILWNASYVTLDGESNNITINGSTLNAGQSMFEIRGDHNTIQNLTVKNSPMDGIRLGDFAGVGSGNNNLVFSLKIIGSGASGVYVYGGGSGGGQNNSISMSLIGTTDNSAAACVPGEGNAYGVYLANNAANTTIGGSIIACSAVDGVSINGAGGSPTGTVITTNGIGTNAADSFVGNGYAGIAIYSGAHSVTIGSANSISGNGRQGIYIAGAGTADIQIYGNKIGTNRFGTAAVGNTNAGIMVADAPSANITIGVNNVISGNGGDGIWIQNSSAVIVKGNQIGTDSNGNYGLPNGGNGITLSDAAQFNIIGGSIAGDTNYISGNSAYGIQIVSGSANNTIKGNKIGGTSSGGAVANGYAGIGIFASDNNTIGEDIYPSNQFVVYNASQGIYIQDSAGTHLFSSTQVNANGLEGVLLYGATNSIVHPSTVYGNKGAGIAVIDSPSNHATGNDILTPNSEGNRGLPVDLGNDGHTPNGSVAPPGPNNWIGYPVNTTVSGTIVNGTACPNCEVRIYLASGDPAMSEGGAVSYKGFVTTDAGGNWSFDLSTYSLTSASEITLAAFNPVTGDTSEMSPRPQVFLPLVLKLH